MTTTELFQTGGTILIIALILIIIGMFIFNLFLSKELNNDKFIQNYKEHMLSILAIELFIDTMNNELLVNGYYLFEN